MNVFRTAILTVGAGLGLMLTAVEAQTPPALEEVVRDVLESTPGLRAEAARLAATEEAVAQARAQGLPNISLAGSFEASDGTYDPGQQGEALIGALFQDLGGEIPLTGNGGTGRTQGQLAITQPIFTGFRIRNGIAEAKSTVEAARAQYAGTRQDYAVRIADAHLSVQTTDAQLASVQKSYDLLQQAKRVAEISFEEGQSTRTDLSLASARLAAVEAQLAQTRAAAVRARNNYVTLAAKPPFTVSLENSVLPVPEMPEEVIETAMISSPEMQTAGHLVDAREAAVRGAKGQRSPTVRLKGAVNYAENNFLEGDTSQNSTLTAEVSVPFYQGGSIGSAVRQAKADARAARFTLSDVTRQVEANARSAYADYQAAVIAYDAAKSQIEAAELAFKGVSLERELGQRSILDVLDVEEDLLNARFQEVEAQRALILSSYRVHRVMGTLLTE